MSLKTRKAVICRTHGKRWLMPQLYEVGEFEDYILGEDVKHLANELAKGRKEVGPLLADLIEWRGYTGLWLQVLRECPGIVRPTMPFLQHLCGKTIPHILDLSEVELLGVQTRSMMLVTRNEPCRGKPGDTRDFAIRKVMEPLAIMRVFIDTIDYWIQGSGLTMIARIVAY